MKCCAGKKEEQILYFFEMLLPSHANSKLYHLKVTWMNEGKGGERGKNHPVLAAQLTNN